MWAISLGLGRAWPRAVGTRRTTRRTRRADAMVVAPGVITLAVMLTGITGASYWTDEGATVAAVRRSLPQLAAMLRNVDAVHGLYYLLLWPLAHAFGTSEVALRLPSAVVTALAASAIAAIGKRLRSRLAGLFAGLVFASEPAVSQWGQNARPYAMTIAAGVLASYLLVAFIDGPGPRRALGGYAASIALLGYLDLFGLLLVPAHAITVWSAGRVPHGPLRAPRLRRWLIAGLGGCAATAPVVVFGWRQRAQIGWLPGPATDLRGTLASTLGAGAIVPAVLLAALAGLGVARTPARDRPGPGEDLLGRLCLPWLLLPPVSLFAASSVRHVFCASYVLFCLPSAALAAGAGLAALRPAWRAAVLAAAVPLMLPGQLAVRAPGGHNEDIRAIALYLRAHARRGDAVLYWRGFWDDSLPDWPSAYPYGFTGLDDIGLGRDAVAMDSLYGTEAPLPVFERRLRPVRRIWVVEPGRDVGSPRILPAGQFRLTARLVTWQMYLRLYTRVRHDDGDLNSDVMGNCQRTVNEWCRNRWR